METNRKRRWAVDLTPLRASRDFRLLLLTQTVSSLGGFITYVAVPLQVALTHPLAAPGRPARPVRVGTAASDRADRRRARRLSGSPPAGAGGRGDNDAHLPRAAPQRRRSASPVVGAIRHRRGQLRCRRAATPRDRGPGATGGPARSDDRRRTRCGPSGSTSASLVGPAIGGVLIATIGFSWAYAIQLVTLSASFVGLLLIAATPPPPDPDRPSVASIVAGLRYARSRPELMGTYIIDICAMFFGMPMALFPFVAGHLGGTPVLGLLYAAPSAGALIATATSGWAGRVHRHGLAVIVVGRRLGRRDRGIRPGRSSLAGVAVPGDRGRRRHDLRRLPRHDLGADHPGSASRPLGRGRDAVLLDRTDARQCRVRPGRPGIRCRRLDRHRRHRLCRRHHPAGLVPADVPALRRTGRNRAAASRGGGLRDGCRLRRAAAAPAPA